jgi:hypothetical protein
VPTGRVAQSLINDLHYQRSLASADTGHVAKTNAGPKMLLPEKDKAVARHPVLYQRRRLWISLWLKHGLYLKASACRLGLTGAGAARGCLYAPGKAA